MRPSRSHRNILISPTKLGIFHGIYSGFMIAWRTELGWVASWLTSRGPKSSIGGMVVDTPSWETVKVRCPWWAHILGYSYDPEASIIVVREVWAIYVKLEFDKTWLDCVVTLNTFRRFSNLCTIYVSWPRSILWGVVPSAETFALSYILIPLFRDI